MCRPTALLSRGYAILVPPGLAPEQARRARLTVGLLLVNIILAIVAVIAVPGLRTPPAVFAVVLATIGSRIGLLVLLRMTGWATFAAHVFVGSFLFLVLLLGVLGGGALSPALVAAPLIPALATLLLSARGGAAWTVLTVCVVATLTAFDVTGLAREAGVFTYPPTWGSEIHREDIVFRGTAASLAAALGFLVALIYEVDRASQVRALEGARREAEDADAAKGRFLANMSHEIRTPMSGVLGVAEVLQATPLDEHQHKLVGVLLASGRGLVALLNDVLDMSKIDAGQLQIEVVEVQLRDLMREVVDSLVPQASAKGISLSLTCDSEVPATVLADGLRVRQVVTNLVSNAVKFTERGGVEVTLSAEARPGGRCDVTLSVSDTGIGMTAEALERVRLPFQQADASTTRRFGGVGLGLTIVRHLVLAMGGELRITSTPGEGSSFRVSLPVDVVDGAETAPVGLQRAATTQPLRVLVVDDEPVSRQVAKLLLSRLGAQVTTADDGQEAVDLCVSDTFDIIFMDVNMPNLDGLQTTRQLRSQYDVQVPIIALTASSFVEDRQACLDAGMDDHLGKPAQVAVLADALRRWSPNLA